MSKAKAQAMDPSERRKNNRLFRWLVAPAAALAIRILARTMRLEFAGEERFNQAMGSGRPLIFAFWHEDLFAIAALHLRVNRGRPFSRPVAVMISRSRDGEMLASVAERLSLTPIRGSSSRGGLGAFLELSHWLKEGEGSGEPKAMVALALDGPRGPRREAKPGAALLARKAGAIVVPVAFRFSREWSFKSWDRTKLGKPWARLECRIAELEDAANWPGDDLAQAKALGEALAKVNEDSWMSGQ